LKGVESDIVLPDTYHYIETGEKELDNAMKWTQIEKREFDQNVYQINDLSDLIKNSQDRITNDPEFQMMEEQANLMKSTLSMISLCPMITDLEQFKTMELERDEIQEKFDDMLDKDVIGLTVLNLPQDTDYIQMDSSRIARNDGWLKNLQKDIYSEEALHVIRDMVK